MKYLRAEVLVGVPDGELKEWSEHSDCTRFLAHRGLENRDFDVYLISHEDYPNITQEEADKIHKCFTDEGGI